MEGVTLVISLAGLAATLVLGAAESVAVFLLVICYYPQALTVPVGTIDFTAGRIVILGVLIAAVKHHRQWRHLRLNALDFWVFVHFGATTLALMTNAEAAKVLENRGGALFDTMFPYLGMRLLITDEKKLIRLIKIMAIGLIPLALFGLYESKTGHNLYSFTAPYQSWGLARANGDPTYVRHGFYRASAAFNNIISFGMFFAGFAPLALALMEGRKWSKAQAAIVAGLLILGLASSMSSGPLFSICVSLAMLPLFRFRDKWPLFAVMVVAAIIFTEVFSNRHFYHVLTLFAFDPENAYYRIGLIEECFGGGMSGHWLFGYGYVGIGPGCANTGFHWEHTDLTNIYIYILARAGLLALIPYLIVNYLYYKRLYQAARYATERSQHWLLWCFAAALVGWNISMMTVSALDQVETLIFMFIALCSGMPAIMRQALLERQATLEADTTAAAVLPGRDELWGYRLGQERLRRLPTWRRRWQHRFGFGPLGDT